MAKWELRSCPRCDGDMFMDEDLYGIAIKCLQCGYARYAGYASGSDKKSDTERKKDKVAVNTGGES